MSYNYLPKIIKKGFEETAEGKMKGNSKIIEK
ncbi:hypothetical protein SAMN04515674_109121 [Pseudarcicella hirudinis]|uniref:Uncharacterized protein n=1 Tax=Pseudarcicella hirudinis TaxID=1079859 RepID=A0A1I5VIW3_9BACT|nr:hypothetical protein SAMN04515674_109121 [Pseudarcicella hirudinis]